MIEKSVKISPLAQQRIKEKLAEIKTMENQIRAIEDLEVATLGFKIGQKVLYPIYKKRPTENYPCFIKTVTVNSEFKFKVNLAPVTKKGKMNQTKIIVINAVIKKIRITND